MQMFLSISLLQQMVLLWADGRQARLNFCVNVVISFHSAKALKDIFELAI